MKILERIYSYFLNRSFKYLLSQELCKQWAEILSLDVRIESHHRRFHHNIEHLSKQIEQIKTTLDQLKNSNKKNKKQCQKGRRYYYKNSERINAAQREKRRLKKLEPILLSTAEQIHNKQ